VQRVDVRTLAPPKDIYSNTKYITISSREILMSS
jgi:hypothetical protein